MLARIFSCPMSCIAYKLNIQSIVFVLAVWLAIRLRFICLGVEKMIEFKRVHCFFEQSGVFRDVFRKLGFEAYDYDLFDSYDRVDHRTDILSELEHSFLSRSFLEDSIFGGFSSDDLVFAFFPCTYFETQQSMYYTLTHANLSGLSLFDKCDFALKRLESRHYYHTSLFRLVALADDLNFKLIVENPFHLNFLTWGNNFPKPTLVDKNRRRRGDYFVKPTAYWFFNCSPTYGQSYVMPEEFKAIANIDKGAGNLDRSLISPEYAKNFINDFILGRSGDVQQLTLDV